MLLSKERMDVIKSKFVAREMGDELIVVPLTGNVAQMNALFTLNETGKFIWNNMERAENISALAGLMANEFDIDGDTAIRDIEIFMTKLNNILLKRI